MLINIVLSLGVILKSFHFTSAILGANAYFGHQADGDEYVQQFAHHDDQYLLPIDIHLQ